MPLSGAETIAKVREMQNETIVSFSTGKDAIAAWLAVRPHFDRVIPYYMYLVPGLEFVDESLDYYERYFGEKIIRVPSPSIPRLMNALVFQPPERCAVIEQAQLRYFNYERVREAVVDKMGLQKDIMYATGVRAADSPMRRIAINRYGPITLSSRKYHPVWDMNKAALVQALTKAKIKLPIDYRWFGRTFDGVDLRFILPLKKHAPRDYAKVLEYYPLAELEVKRWEYANGH